MSSSLLWCLLVFFLVGEAIPAGTTNPKFDTNYEITWGYDHVQSIDQGTQIQLSMDNSSGSGFGSKLNYGSGFFSLKIKLPDKDSAGVVTAYYLNSHSDKYDVLDFEFLGNKQGKPYTLQTNVFTNGEGNREQRIHLWFDPTADFHYYKILWNQHQIVFYVDTAPIWVFKNMTNIGVNYPTQAMQIEASLWDGESWATDGGQTKTDWSQTPFKANFQGFNIDGCPTQNSNTNQSCNSSKYWWNTEKYWQLNSTQGTEYEEVKSKYMTYDYCSDRSRYPSTPPECPQ
ncbi:xyloglucan endotransglucosylase/hydrolase protein 2-like [Telopea speciosissima]|uniref:xyloglucan endotransglucosylase/hydrolase protein 2-like n=1 Tax=Telopea speciosissima TaxID=54955 RepID=UPI001CC343BE|nr:xyloglucan endotransglucosylase/hydrolase protein 2-like [Telopea speciosissima]